MKPAGGYKTFNSSAITVAVVMSLSACGSGSSTPSPLEWPIATDVFTTAQQQIRPVAVAADTTKINPADVSLYKLYGYSNWLAAPGTNYGTDANNPQTHEKRTELAPAYAGAANVARLLSFFSMTDIHISDKESPAQAIYPAWSSLYGPTSGGLTGGAWTPTILATTHVLDAAIQTVNALHQKSPIDFGISLGDNINNAQYNELRGFIDVLDGNLIVPSSGAHAGADTIDYQKPYKAAGLNKAIPWYTAIGNHDQFWMGILYENAKTTRAHIGNTILDLNLYSINQPLNPNWSVDQTGFYMGVVDGSTPYGTVTGSGPVANFAKAPTVVADPDRRSLATDESSRRNYMSEFFKTTSSPAGHGFTQSNIDNDFASYTFEPKAGLPLKVIVLDDTCKKNDTLGRMAYYGTACLEQMRIDWLKLELQKGQDEGKLMIIAAHLPIKPQASLSDKTPTYMFYDKTLEDTLLATLHSYPNLILWIAGHRHQNTVTPQPFNASNPSDHPEGSFWEVQTSSLRDFPQQFRIFEIRRNADNTLSIIITNVDPAVTPDSPAGKSRDYAIGTARIFGATPAILADTTSHSYNAELVKQLTPQMQEKIQNYGTSLAK